MATMWKVLLCLLLTNLVLAQNSTSLEGRFAALERKFVIETANLRSELQSTKADLEITRLQLLDTQTEIKQPANFYNVETTNFETDDERSNMKNSESTSKNVLDWDNITKPRKLSQILEKWVQKASTILTKPCRAAQGDQTKPEPEIRITTPETTAHHPPTSALTHSEPQRRSRRNAGSYKVPQLPARRAVNSHTVPAFHAELGIPAENLKSQQSIVFDSTTLNIGQSYREDSGAFVCPEAGIYFFTVTIMVFPREKVETELVVNGDQVMLTYSAGNSGFNQGTSSTAVRLEDGDMVWVRIFDNPSLNTGVNIRVMGGGWSTFTGYKIQ